MKKTIDDLIIYSIFSKMIVTHISKIIELYLKGEINDIYTIFLFDLNHEIHYNLLK